MTSTHTFKLALPKFRLAPRTQYHAATFISGFKAASSLYKIAIVKATVSAGHIEIELDLGGGGVEVVTLAYAVF